MDSQELIDELYYIDLSENIYIDYVNNKLEIQDGNKLN